MRQAAGSAPSAPRHPPRAYPSRPRGRDGPGCEECKERGGIDAGDSIADDERRSNPTHSGPSLRVAAGPGRLRRCGSSTMLASASTASPRLVSGPVAHATRLTRPTGIGSKPGLRPAASPTGNVQPGTSDLCRRTCNRPSRCSMRRAAGAECASYSRAETIHLLLALLLAALLNLLLALRHSEPPLSRGRGKEHLRRASHRGCFPVSKIARPAGQVQ